MVKDHEMLVQTFLVHMVHIVFDMLHNCFFCNWWLARTLPVPLKEQELTKIMIVEKVILKAMYLMPKRVLLIPNEKGILYLVRANSGWLEICTFVLQNRGNHIVSV